MPYIPEYTGNIGADLSLELGGKWTFNARWDTMFVGDTWFSPVQDDYVPNFFTGFGFGGGEYSKQRRDSFVRHDATMSVRNGQWSVQLWGRNVTDEEYLEEVIPAPEFGGSFIHDTFGRTYGVTLQWHYGG
jgi:iron complex outermembrane receptor protein